MKRDRKRPLDEVAAERLLAGGGGPAYLASVIAAASACLYAGELAGERAALAAFVEARDAVARGTAKPGRSAPAPAGLSPRHVRARPRWGRLVPVKVAGLALALALAGGGLALAASTGVLPSLGPADVPSVGQSGRPATSSLSSRPGAGSPGASAFPPLPGASPGPSLDGLCRAYLVQDAADRAKAHQNPAFDALFAAAGGVDQASGFCEARLAAAPGGTPSPSGKPGTHPTGPPSPHATGGPTHR